MKIHIRVIFYQATYLNMLSEFFEDEIYVNFNFLKKCFKG